MYLPQMVCLLLATDSGRGVRGGHKLSLGALGRRGRAAVLGLAAAVPGQPAALGHGGGAARAVRPLRARGRAARAQQAGRARPAAAPQLRVHHLRERARRRRLPQRRGASLFTSLSPLIYHMSIACKA
jgi:hypothetical protein